MTIGPGGMLIAFGAGIGSFLLPCTLPLVPGYISYISGLSAEDVEAGKERGTLATAAVLFVLGFSLVFVALGATASYIGSALLPHRATLVRLSGIFIIIMALLMLGLFRLPVFQREMRLHLGRDLGIWSALPLGMAFAFGWSPCIGPVLASILAYATTEQAAQKGALLLFIYSLGMGVPFIALALLAGHMFQSVRRLKRFARMFEVVGGSALLVMGILLFLNQWTRLMAPIMRWYLNLNLPT